MQKLHRIHVWAVLMALTCVLALPLAAQKGQTQIKGTVTGEDGKPMEGATAILTPADASGGAPQTVKTDVAGKYAFNKLPTGSYMVTVNDPTGKMLYTEAGIVTDPSGAVVKDVNMKLIAAAKARADNAKVANINQMLRQNQALQIQNKWDDAIAIVQQILAIDQKHDVVYEALAEDYSGAKQYDKAEDAYQKAIALNPNKAAYHMNLGAAYNGDKKYDDAITEFGKAAQMDPKLAASANMNMAAVYTNQGKTDDALTKLDAAIAADPNNEAAWFQKSVALFSKATIDPKTNKYIAVPGTVEALKKVIALAPPNSDDANTAKGALDQIGGR